MPSLSTTLASIKTRKATTASLTQHLGSSIHDKIQNARKEPKNIITHLHAPEGQADAVAAMKSTFEQKFGFELPAELISFYEQFDGFEWRNIPLKQEMKYFLEESESWLVDQFKLPSNFADLSLEEWQSPTYQDAFSEISAILRIANFGDLDQIHGRSTNPSAKDILYYNEHVDQLDNHASRTVIPAAKQLFNPGNKSGAVDGIELYYFDFFSSFAQIVLGIKDQKIALYQAQYGYGDLRKIKENIPTYLKKIIVRA